MGPRVLIVDLRSPQCELLHSLLVRNGLDVLVLHRAADAVASLAERPVRLVICALGVPKYEEVVVAAKSGSEGTRSILLTIGGMTLTGEAAEQWDAQLCHPIRSSDLATLLADWGLLARQPQRTPNPWRAIPVAVPRTVIKPPILPTPVVLQPPLSPSVPIPAPLALKQHPLPTPPTPFADHPKPRSPEADSQAPSPQGQRPRSELQTPHRKPEPLELEPQPLEPEPQPLELEPQPLELEPQPLEPEPQPLELEPQPLELEPQPLEPEPQPLELEPQPLELEPQPLELEPQPLELEPQPLEPEPQPLGADSHPTPESPPLSKPPSAGVQEAAVAAAPRFAAPCAAAGGLPGVGRLEDYGLPYLVVRLYRAGFTGTLHLSRNGVDRSLVFSCGTPVRVDSTQLSETLGQMLLADGKITEQQFRFARAIVEAEKVRPGEALVAVGALTESELLAALAQQTETKLINSFAWRDGEFSIETGDRGSSPTLEGDVHPLWVVWRGVFEQYDGFELAESLAPEAGQYIVASDLFAVHLEVFRGSLAELEFFALLDGQTTVRQALDRDREAIDRVAKALFVLRLSEMIQLRPIPGRAMKVQEPAAAESTPADQEASEVRDYSELITRHLLFLKDSDFFTALRLEAQATDEEVDAAYREQIQLLRLRDPPAGLAASTLKQVNEIRAILFDAWETLHDPARRQRYHAEQKPTTAHRGAISVSVSRFDRATQMLRDRDFDAARQELEAAIASNPNEPAYRIALAKVALAEGGAEPGVAAVKQAIGCLEQALFLDPSNIEASLELAELLLGSGHVEVAADHVARVLRCAPLNQSALAMMHKLQFALSHGHGATGKGSEYRQRLKVRCRQAGEKDAVGYTTVVGYESLFVNTRTLYRVNSELTVELELPLAGTILLEGVVSATERPPRGVEVIQLESGMRLKITKAPDQWRIFIGSLAR